MTVLVQDVLNLKTEFKVDYVKADGSSREGVFTVAKDQRKTENPNLVTLIETKTGEYRGLDVTRINSISAI